MEYIYEADISVIYNVSDVPKKLHIELQALLLYDCNDNQSV